MCSYGISELLMANLSRSEGFQKAKAPHLSWENDGLEKDKLVLSQTSRTEMVSSNNSIVMKMDERLPSTCHVCKAKPATVLLKVSLF